MPLFLSDGETALMSWKQGYAVTRRQNSALAAWRTSPVILVPRTASRVPYRRRPKPRSILEIMCSYIKHMQMQFPWDNPFTDGGPGRVQEEILCSYRLEGPGPAEELTEEETKETAPIREETKATAPTRDNGRRAVHNGNRTTTTAVQSSWYRKGHDAGAIHSPPSRYRWRHR
ncbi:hypothetical protein BAE44_0002488 [Dichanthelium oligosanthes]|uniref:Uncharacterized protein n=1 Tax=Dichanthelium oligosanthes TaxID=888268 RepID=A0A1E5WGG9_9POAL|nr:hypothetical protein BAE44_0002488 [Dichanthelium oligosanthes]